MKQPALSIMHTPVLLNEVLALFKPIKPPETNSETTAPLLLVDATLGGAGHSRALLTQILSPVPNSKLWGLDRDPVALAAAKNILHAALQATAMAPERFELFACNYSQLQSLLKQQGISCINGGVLADLGTSAFQLEEPLRGFSFLHDGPLDMRMSITDETESLTADEIINTWPEKELADLFFSLGEEPLARVLAQRIVNRRAEAPFKTTRQLALCIEQAYRQKYTKTGPRQQRTHPATRVFQALRMRVNNELEHLQAFLNQLPQILAPGSRAVIITFHSLEDRLVKQAFKQESLDCLCPPRFPVCQCGHRATFKLLTPKPIVASTEELAANPRARSAKLRAVERV